MALNHDMQTQIELPIVFSLKREESALYNYHLSLGLSAEEQFLKTKLRSEEFIISEIGKMKMKSSKSTRDKSVFRSLLNKPSLFLIKNNKIEFLFDHDVRYLSQSLRNNSSIRDEFMKEITNILKNESE